MKGGDFKRLFGLNQCAQLLLRAGGSEGAAIPFAGRNYRKANSRRIARPVTIKLVFDHLAFDEEKITLPRQVNLIARDFASEVMFTGDMAGRRNETDCVQHGGQWGD